MGHIRPTRRSGNSEATATTCIPAHLNNEGMQKTWPAQESPGGHLEIGRLSDRRGVCRRCHFDAETIPSADERDPLVHLSAQEMGRVEEKLSEQSKKLIEGPIRDL